MARMLPGALLAPLASTVIDTRRRERVLLVVCLIRAATLAGAAAAVSTPASPLAAYVLVAFASGLHAVPARALGAAALVVHDARAAERHHGRARADGLAERAGRPAAGRC